MLNALLDARKTLDNKRQFVDMDEWKKGYNAGLDAGILAIESLDKQVVHIQTVQALLKETYLDVANEFDVSDLKHDSDKVSVIASKFRSVMLEKLAHANEEVKSTVKVVGEPKNNVFPMRIRCQRVVDSDGFAYGNAVDFCGRELEIESHDVKMHKWYKYPNYSGKDYGVVCPVCKKFVVIDENKLPKYVKDAAEEIYLN